MSSGWISVRNWRKFQHYDPAKRAPKWIKVYAELMSDPAFLGLTAHQRGVLVSLWLEYASSRCQLSANTASLTRQLNARVSSRQLKALSDAGFIDIVASKLLADGYQDASPEVEVEKNPLSPPTRGAPSKGSRRRPRGGTVPEPFSIAGRWKSYIDNVAYLHNADPLHNQLTFTDALEELAYWRTLPLAENDISDEDAREQWDEAHQSLADLPL